MSDLDLYFDQHAYWDRERQEGPTDWGQGDDGSEPLDPTPEEWAELQAEIDLQRQTPSASPPAPVDGEPEL
ncbi:hypothetical protein [Deinococcus alpinitundrae]|uniref:hypothetical protein n=1 Tax=Deinococcus alpinitundrae TaxID=468913 RepID=UPI00137A11B0|nr:hypothetical protein [Deinococcus alpinitundrae]